MDSKRFMPHNASTTVKYYGTSPALYFTPHALDKMRAYVGLCSDEIGWLGKVTEYEGKAFLCDEVYLVRQEVAAATTEISPAGLVELDMEIGDDAEHLRLWGHSHVNMGVSPSGQDADQMKLFQENKCPWFWRIIANKKGALEATFYDYELGLEFRDVPWSVYYEAAVDHAAIEAEIKAKVSKKTYAYSGGYYSGKVGSAYETAWGERWNAYSTPAYKYGAWDEDAGEYAAKTGKVVPLRASDLTDKEDDVDAYLGELEYIQDVIAEEALLTDDVLAAIYNSKSPDAYVNHPGVQRVMQLASCGFYDVLDAIDDMFVEVGYDDYVGGDEYATAE